jgi:hypothetical protein
MYGKRGLEQQRDGGDDIIPKKTIRAREEKQAFRDADEEMAEDG